MSFYFIKLETIGKFKIEKRYWEKVYKSSYTFTIDNSHGSVTCQLPRFSWLYLFESGNYNESGNSLVACPLFVMYCTCTVYNVHTRKT